MALDPTLAARLFLVVAGAIFVLGAFVWPTLRLWRRAGVFAFTPLRSPDPMERTMGLAFVGMTAAYGTIAALYAWRGPEAVGTAPSGWLRVGLAAGAMAAGIAVTMIAQAQMGRSWRIGIDTSPTALVTTGLYRWVRSPIYSGVLLLLGGLAALIATPAALLGWPLVAAILTWQSRREEAHMTILYPDEFPAWVAKTGRFLPRLW